MNTGQKIRDLRKKHGITQKALADKLGTSPQNLAQYESGKRHPKIETLQKIADALEIPVSDIIGTGFLNIPDDKIDYFAGKGGLVVQDPQEVHLNEVFDTLNSKGKNKAIEQIELIAMIPEYQKDPE